MSDAERRSLARYEPKQGAIFIGWTGPSGFVSTRAEIVNISLGGAAISVTGFPSGLCSALIRLIADDQGHRDWVSGSVLEVRTILGGQQRIRMRFDGFCPYDFFKAILFTTEASDETTQADRRPETEPLPSPGPASLPRAAALPPSAAPARQQPAPVVVVQNIPVSGNRLRSALSARESGRANNLRGPARIPGW
jgi:hypothetical protein